MPEYTVSLLIWILPILFFEGFFRHKKLLARPKRKALLITVAVLASIGIVLDLLFARFFFVFPDKDMTLGLTIRGIPFEEFIFYIAGFCFILYLYIFCDEWYLVKYNPPDYVYARYRSRLKRMIYIHKSSMYQAAAFVLCGIVVKNALNPAGCGIPGYFLFLVAAAYIPSILFYRITRSFVNWRAFFFTLVITVLISLIWEVTLALPRGYWGYQQHFMLGIFIPVWHHIPIEAVTVWIFCTLIIMVYEYLKITFFTGTGKRILGASKR